MSDTRFEHPYESLTIAESNTEPFHYFLADRCLAPAVEADLLSWFETDAPWHFVETDFYQQFEFDMRGITPKPRVAPVASPESLECLRLQIGGLLGTTFDSEVQVVAHRLEAGQRIGIHNDLREGGETHRLTIQLNRGAKDADGGFFMLFNSEDPTDVHRVLRPLTGSGIGFAIGPSSHHAVSRVHAGTRYTLVYSFRAATRG